MTKISLEESWETNLHNNVLSSHWHRASLNADIDNILSKESWSKIQLKSHSDINKEVDYILSWRNQIPQNIKIQLMLFKMKLRRLFNLNKKWNN